MPSSANHQRRGFTLLEIMISVAIIGVLTIMVFVAFANEQSRNAAKRLAENIQIAIQEQQAAAQSGLTVSGVQPGAFGLAFSTGNAIPQTTPMVLRYIIFGDGLGGGAMQQEYDNPAEYIRNVNLPTNLRILSLVSNGVSYGRADITFDVPDGSVILKAYVTTPPYVTLATPLVITVRQTTDNICYSVTIQPKFGTVSRRLIDTLSPSCS